MKQNGFTLFELLVALAIAAILVTVGIPSLRDMIMDNRIIAQANHFVATMNAARSSAVRYQRTAIVCATSDFDAAVPTCSDSSTPLHSPYAAAARRRKPRLPPVSSQPLRLSRSTRGSRISLCSPLDSVTHTVPWPSTCSIPI